jgi:peptidoglycan/LPS O-acetylase OafA/YrhL
MAGFAGDAAVEVGFTPAESVWHSRRPQEDLPGGASGQSIAGFGSVDGAGLTQYPALTALRFIAALLVFLFHFPPQIGFLEVLADEGHVGVGVFFVLSGFLITLRYADPVARGEVRLGEYFLRRAARILPLYYVVFFASLALGGGEPPLSAALVPELTLTHALFGEAIDQFVIPTSWSLTVEECFYALAPLVFLGVAAARRRHPSRPLAAAAGSLILTSVMLFSLGLAVSLQLDGRGPAFLREPYHIAVHTLFGRFPDFACGSFAALVFISPGGARIRAALARSGPSALLTLAAAALIYVAQMGMHEAGGIEAVRWIQMWRWEALLAPATAGLILSLTSFANPFARFLGREPFVYLGKVSYALYLVQSTTLGKGLFYRVLPHHGYLALAALYVGMTIISVALYELIEEPARRAMLRAFGVERPESEAPSTRSAWSRVAVAAVVAIVIGVQGATWLATASSKSAGPITAEELIASGLRASDRVVVDATGMRWGRDVLLVDIPRRWREGWGNDLRAPRGLFVFLDGAPIPFSRREPAGDGVAAFFRGPRAEHLALRVSTPPYEMIVVRESPFVLVRAHAGRLLGNATGLAALAVLMGLVLGLGLAGLSALTLRGAMTLGLGLLGALAALDAAESIPALVGVECAVVGLLAVRDAWVRRMASRVSSLA